MNLKKALLIERQVCYKNGTLIKSQNIKELIKNKESIPFRLGRPTVFVNKHIINDETNTLLIEAITGEQFLFNIETGDVIDYRLDRTVKGNDFEDFKESNSWGTSDLEYTEIDSGQKT